VAVQLRDREPARERAVAVVVETHPGLVLRAALLRLEQDGLVLVRQLLGHDGQHASRRLPQPPGVHSVDGLRHEPGLGRPTLLVGDAGRKLLGCLNDHSRLRLVDPAGREGLPCCVVPLLEQAREPDPARHDPSRGPDQRCGPGVRPRRSELLREATSVGLGEQRELERRDL
jgi:hypothetical protein